MPLTPQKREELHNDWVTFRAKKGLGTHPADIYEFWLDKFDQLLIEKQERIEKLKTDYRNEPRAFNEGLEIMKEDAINILKE